MSWDWQTVSALLIVAGAVVCLVWQVRRAGAGKQLGCGHCDTNSGCNSQSKVRPLVTLSPPRETSPGPHDG